MFHPTLPHAHRSRIPTEHERAWLRYSNPTTAVSRAHPAGSGSTSGALGYSGLSDEEIRRLDRWIRDNTIERFGPVRAVKPVHVFELAFEGIGASPRHRSGVAVRFPRTSRWRTDKTPEQADTLEQVKEIMRGASQR